MFKLNMKPEPSQGEQIGAFFNMDNNNGILLLFEKQGDHFQQVYERKWWLKELRFLAF